MEKKVIKMRIPFDVPLLIKELREGKEVVCPFCHKGLLMPVGDYKTTHGFYCDRCNEEININ